MRANPITMRKHPSTRTAQSAAPALAKKLKYTREQRTKIGPQVPQLQDSSTPSVARRLLEQMSRERKEQYHFFYSLMNEEAMGDISDAASPITEEMLAKKRQELVHVIIPIFS